METKAKTIQDWIQVLGVKECHVYKEEWKTAPQVLPGTHVFGGPVTKMPEDLLSTPIKDWDLVWGKVTFFI